MTTNKKVYVIGGGTFNHIRTHLSLSVPAFGTTAKQIFEIAKKQFKHMDVKLVLTKMADSSSSIITNEDVENWVNTIVNLNDTKIVFFNAAICDYDGSIGEEISGKYSTRLETAQGEQILNLKPSNKIVGKIREKRKDIFLIAFKTTSGATEQEMYLKGLKLMKTSHCNLVLVNDVQTRLNLIITPEEAKYAITSDREKALTELVDIAYHRSHLSFTRSTVVDGKPVDWNSSEVYPSLREVVNYCIKRNAYKPFNGATVGHFACKINDTTFLTSIRKTNFNDIEKNGLVKVITDGPDSVIAYGAKPSVGGQSQRLIFSQHGNVDCIVHFNCPIKPTSKVPVVSQREFECGSHECGQNTSSGLGEFNDGRILAVMLDNHGPNIVFNHNINPQEVIDFIEENFILEEKTSGFVQVELKQPETAL